MINPIEFWEWFDNNNAKFFFLNQIDDNDEKESIMNELQAKLHEYDNQLYFEIGGHPNEKQELIITCNGNKEKFNQVKNLVNLSPKIPNWEIIAFKQPNDESFTINTRGIEACSDDLWILPLKNPKQPKFLGVKVAFDLYPIENKEDYIYIANLVLESKLGEENFALYIKYIDVIQKPIGRDSHGYIKFEELNNYLSWFLKK